MPLDDACLLFLILTCTAAAKWALLEHKWKQERLPCATWSMRVRFGLHSGVDGDGTCVSSVFNPHTGLQQCPACLDLGVVGMQCPASHPVCCVDQRCVQHATQCTCGENNDCPLGMCCNGNHAVSLAPPNPADSGRCSWVCPVLTCIVVSGAGMLSMPLDDKFLVIFLLTSTAAAKRADLEQNWKRERPSCASLVYARAVWIAFRFRRVR
jgi:hypothetical protein